MASEQQIQPVVDGQFDTAAWEAALQQGHGPVTSRRIGIVSTTAELTNAGWVPLPAKQHVELTNEGWVIASGEAK